MKSICLNEEGLKGGLEGLAKLEFANDVTLTVFGILSLDRSPLSTW